MRIPFQRKSILLIIITVTGIIIAGIITHQNQETYLNASQLVSHTQENLYIAEQLFSKTKDLQTGLAGHIITGNPQFLLKYYPSVHAVSADLLKLKGLVKDNPLQSLRLDTLSELINKRIAFSNRVISLRKQKKIKPAIDLISTNEGAIIMDKIRKLGGDILSEENRLLAQYRQNRDEYYSKFMDSFYLLILGICFFILTVSVILYNNRKVTLNALNKEIEQQKEVGEIVKESESRLRMTLDKIGDYAWEHDFITGKTIFSGAKENLLGYKNDEAADNASLWLDSAYKDDRWMLEQNDAKYKKGLIDYHSMEYRIYHKDGSLKWVQDRGYVIEKNKDGTPIKIVGIHTDITQRKLSEQALRESEHRFKDLAQNIPGVVYQWQENYDGSFGFNYVSPKLKDYFDVEPEEMYRVTELIHPDDKEAWRKSIEESKKNESHWDFEGRLLYPDGKIKWWKGSSVISVKNEKGIVYNGIMTDITERKLAEEQLKSYSVQLQNKNKELEQFTYIASHDLQEPLRSINGFANLLEFDLEKGNYENVKQYLQYITQASERMSKLIKSLLDYSRIGSHKQLQLVNCNQLVNDAILDLDAAIRTTHATIHADTLPMMKVYPDDFRLLLQNLISNAIKFRKKDTAPVINISAKRNDNYWLFSVADNGIGIDEKFVTKIFSIFQRLHNKGEYEGTGIGLAHCKKIVELHNGEIWVESKFGEGSIFYFTISLLN